jgi:aminotransferase
MYTPNRGLLELREEIARYEKKAIGIGYNPQEEILVTVGVSEAVDLAFRALLAPGDEVLIPEPCFVAYAPCATLAHGRRFRWRLLTVINIV